MVLNLRGLQEPATQEILHTLIYLKDLNQTNNCMMTIEPSFILENGNDIIDIILLLNSILLTL